MAIQTHHITHSSQYHECHGIQCSPPTVAVARQPTTQHGPVCTTPQSTEIHSSTHKTSSTVPARYLPPTVSHAGSHSPCGMSWQGDSMGVLQPRVSLYQRYSPASMSLSRHPKATYSQHQHCSLHAAPPGTACCVIHSRCSTIAHPSICLLYTSPSPRD